MGPFEYLEKSLENQLDLAVNLHNSALLAVIVFFIKTICLEMHVVPWGFLRRVGRRLSNCMKKEVSLFDQEHFQVSHRDFLMMSKEDARQWCKAVVKPDVMTPEDQEFYEDRCAILDRRLHMDGLELSRASTEDLVAQLAPGDLQSMTPADEKAYMLALIILDHVKMLDSVNFIKEQADPDTFKCRLYEEAFAAAEVELSKRASEMAQLEQTMQQSELQPLPSTSSASASGPALKSEKQALEVGQLEQKAHQSEPQPLPSDSSASAPGPSSYTVQEKEEDVPLLRNDPSAV